MWCRQHWLVDPSAGFVKHVTTCCYTYLAPQHMGSAVLLIVALAWPLVHESLTAIRSNFLPLAPPYQGLLPLLAHPAGRYNPAQKHPLNSTSGSELRTRYPSSGVTPPPIQWVMNTSERARLRMSGAFSPRLYGKLDRILIVVRPPPPPS